MKIIIICILMLVVFAFEAFAKEPGWFCEEESGKREGNLIYACGVGEGHNEMAAREHALAHAINEFKSICELSSDCKGKSTIVTPMRMSCNGEPSKNVLLRGTVNWKCYRLIVITVDR